MRYFATRLASSARLAVMLEEFAALIERG